MDEYLHYLAAKRSVDDRSINRHVTGALRAELSRADEKLVRVLEVGAGTGSMLARMVEWDLVRQVEHTAVDRSDAALAEARRSLAAWARRRGWRCAEEAGGVLSIAGDGRAIKLRTLCDDLFDLDGLGDYDLLLANAVLDLVDVPAALPRLWRHLVSGGLYWFTINFDGETIFEPELDAALDAQIAELYHRTMRDRRTGRRLFTQIPASGAEILAAGASDWVVHAVRGRYPGDEAAFLHHILDTVERALRGSADLDPARLRWWIDARRRQIESGELVFIAHQVDVFGRVPRESGR